MNFLYNFQPQPTLLELGPLAIRWYGLLLAVGLLAGTSVCAYLTKKRGKNSEDVYSLAFWLAIFGIIGARLYDVLFIDWDYFSRNLLEIFKIWQGGLAIHGGIIGGAIGLMVWCKLKKQSIPEWLDLAVVGLSLGQAIGRFGNYFNQELFGRPTDLPWAIPIDLMHRPQQHLAETHFHPAFLYESLLNLMLFGLLLYLIRRGKLPAGAIAGIYVAGYGLIRFVLEFIRIDETAMIFDWRLPQVVSTMIIIGAVVFLFFILNKKKTHQ